MRFAWIGVLALVGCQGADVNPSAVMTEFSPARAWGDVSGVEVRASFGAVDPWETRNTAYGSGTLTASLGWSTADQIEQECKRHIEAKGGEVLRSLGDTSPMLPPRSRTRVLKYRISGKDGGFFLCLHPIGDGSQIGYSYTIVEDR